MKAVLFLRGRTDAPEGVRYRLAFVPAGQREPAVLYDNHHPKGHHKHVDGAESPYEFTSILNLQIDFAEETARWKKRQRGSP